MRRKASPRKLSWGGPWVRTIRPIANACRPFYRCMVKCAGWGCSISVSNCIAGTASINASGEAWRSWPYCYGEDSMDFKSLVGSIALLVLALAPAYGRSSPATSISSSSTFTISAFNVPVSTSVYVSSSSISTTTWRTMPNTAFQVGEDLSYVVRWGIVTGGHSSLAIHGIDKVLDRPAYHIFSEARSSGFVDTFYKTRDRNATWLDTQSLPTLRYEKHIHEGR